MRAVTFVIVAAAAGGALFKYQQSKTPAVEKKTPASLAAKTQPGPTAAPSPSQHWPKRAIDRAAEVKRDVAAKRKANEVP